MRRTTELLTLAAALFVAPSCIEIGESPPEDAAEPAAEQADDASFIWRVEPQSPVANLDDARYDSGWRAAPSVDSAYNMGFAPPPTDSIRGPADSVAIGAPALADTFHIAEVWEDIGRDTTWLARGGDAARPPALSLPLGGKVAGPSVLQTQVLLDLADFSPGAIDGRWGANVERALFWFQRQEGLPPTGQLDSTTLDRLWESAGRPGTTVDVRVLTAQDVSGPFNQIPEDVYEKAKLDCLCYESIAEKLAELAHTTPEVLEQLNSGRDLHSMKAGDSIRVPAVGRFGAEERASEQAPTPNTVARDSIAHSAARDSATPAPNDSIAQNDSVTSSARHDRVARIVVSDRGRYLHALDASGRIVYHFPATIGSEYFPSPTGEYRVKSIHENPRFYYQPALLEGVDPNEPTARLAPGPNSPVGTAWIALSKEHFGIHGTDEPESIGYVTSSGCVRLTNWDAMALARSIAPGVVVEFRDLAEDRAASSVADSITPPSGTR